MGAFDFGTTTNSQPQSRYDVSSYLMPARAFFFIVVEEPGKDGFLVRKIYATPTSPYLSNMGLSPLQQLSEVYPEKYGMTPKNWGSGVSVAEHVMGNNKSPYLSTSSIFPEGSPRFQGKDIIIDIGKAKASGARLVSTAEILKSLEEYKAKNPHLVKRIDKISQYVRDVDKEILVHGKKSPPKLFSPPAL
ncbi:hypothetical protein Jab_1c23150 [Janthinobacterium sp. HH01]|uniref:hypothetical protein n=1 Tax=Janthinobacterium sp. HH01 TaxID=1198452 RepID=UPI0002AE8FD9|nr:hypothetical protein [Janthinobacterium sp. HH01]ELX13677.1 hypothetical protein Jab_1c23150 [Janthinobacterium sp. HH01]